MVAADRVKHIGTQTFINSITQGYGDEKLNLKHRTEALGHQPAIKLPRNVVKKYVDTDSLRKTAEQRLEAEVKRKIGSGYDDDDDFAPMHKSTKRSDYNLSQETKEATDALIALLA